MYSDSLTFRFYTEKRWNELLSAGNRAVKAGYDYYYMRMRMGIAYYVKHNYVMSAIQFRKALEFNENDQAALEYLFYSYYLSGRTTMSWALMSSFYPQNRERILNESKIHKNSVTIESFLSDAGTDRILSDPDSYFFNTEPGNQIVTNYFINNALYASHIVGKNVSYFHSYTNLIKDNYLHYFDGTNTAHLLSQRIVQHQYYGSINFFTSTGWVFSPSLHLLTTGYPLIYISATGAQKRVRSYDVRTYGLNAGMAVTKSIGYVVFGAEAGYFEYNSAKNLQGTFSFMVYPLGNSDIYIGGKVSAGKDSYASNTSIIKGLTAGFSISRKVWIEFSGLTGDMKNYSDNNGLSLYSSADILKNKITGRIMMPFKKAGLTIFAGGGISSYSSEFIPESGIATTGLNKLVYNSINFTGGITWNF